MHTVGKSCALLEPALGRPIVAISARFKSPIPLGEEVALSADTASGAFVVTCAGRRAADGTFTAAQPQPGAPGFVSAIERIGVNA
jgi:hypothetical protein